MDKCTPPNLDKGERWLPSVNATTWQSAAVSLPNPEPAEIETVVVSDGPQLRTASIPASPTHYTWETKLDRLLIRIAPLLGRDPLSTMVGACFGLAIIGSALDSPTAWLTGASIMILGRMLNER